MSDQNEIIETANANNTEVKTTMPTIIYVLYLANLVVPFSALVGLILAYINKDGNPEFIESHYRFQIRTFWIGLLYVIVGALLTIIFIGWLIIAFYFIWLIIRCAKGLKQLGNRQPMPDPTSWMFG